MDFYQGIVADFLYADRNIFLNQQFCLQLNEAANPDNSGPHWYVDMVAVDMKERVIYLCEVSYSLSLAALRKRISSWAKHWDGIGIALRRDGCLPEWPVGIWVFVPTALREKIVLEYEKIRDTSAAPMPPLVVTILEDVQPWKYKSWNRARLQEDEVLTP